MKIAIAQINPTVGDLDGNCARILRCAEEAIRAGASLLVTPEMALCGYSPEDLLLRADFNQACRAALRRLAAEARSIALLVGHPEWIDGHCYNAASLLADGRIQAGYRKQQLPNYSVFDEVRYFSPGHQALVFEHQGVRLGVLICADLWDPAPAADAVQAGAELLLAMNASPFHLDKQAERHAAARARVAETGRALVYVNMVGGQDELVFDGASFALDADGALVRQCAEFEETLAVFEFRAGWPLAGEVQPSLPPEAAVYRALCLGLRDYVDKNGFPGVILGLSGGIDSALTLAIAVDALGADRVRAIMMPTAFTAAISLEDARAMAGTLGVRYSELPIEPLYALFVETLSADWGVRAPDVTEENLQARIRGMLLMAYSNKLGGIVLTTGNKSEMAVGYSTLYGDMAGGFALLKDVSKTMVYRLVRYRNALAPVIPQRAVDRPPSAELRHNQTDQDSLPPYATLDAIMEASVERDCSRADIIAQGHDPQDVDHVLRMIERSEYKRRQAPIGVRVTRRAFGRDWRYPVTAKFDLTGSPHSGEQHEEN